VQFQRALFGWRPYVMGLLQTFPAGLRAVRDSSRAPTVVVCLGFFEDLSQLPVALAGVTERKPRLKKLCDTPRTRPQNSI
jgi:hypothetical protein